MYPVSQSVVPETHDPHSELEKGKMLAQFTDAGLFRTRPVRWTGAETLESLPVKKREMPDMNLRRVKAVADMQFGSGAGKALLNGKVELVLSKNTGRIRNVMVDGRHMLSMRAGDGFFTLKPAGARSL